MSMDNYDPNTEQQVWQRVFARPVEPQGEDLRVLLLAAMELSASYRYLSGVLTGKQREQVKMLFEGEQANIACLKGIGMLSGRGDEILKIWNPSREPARRILEKCYHSTRRCLIEYTARSADSEFGAVFQKMAEREGKHCATVAELLGGMK